MSINDNEHDLLQAYLEAIEFSEKKGREAHDANKLKNEAEGNLIKYLEETDKKSFESTTLNAGIRMRKELRVKIKPEFKDEAFRFIDEDCGRGDMIKVKKDVHWKTLVSFIGDKIKNAEPFPQEIFDRYWQPILTVIRSK